MNANQVGCGSFRCIVAFIADTGRVLRVQESFVESTAEIVESQPPLAEADIEAVRRDTSRGYEGCRVEAIVAPSGFVFKPESRYWVDPVSREIREFEHLPEMFGSFPLLRNV